MKFNKTDGLIVGVTTLGLVSSLICVGVFYSKLQQRIVDREVYITETIGVKNVKSTAGYTNSKVIDIVARDLRDAGRLTTKVINSGISAGVFGALLIVYCIIMIIKNKGGQE